MNKDIYPFFNLEEDFIYAFVSEGIRGKILKAVLISPLPYHPEQHFNPLFNLGFGDFIELDDEWMLDDSVRSGNGDMPKVIATVARIAMEFLRKHLEYALSFQGYNDQKSIRHGKNHRNMLYQRGINSNWSELSAHLTFWGDKAGHVEEYVVGNQYDQILVKLK
ncbi:hypothetical protein LZD49_09110 [Dyadobacter sp. CY261]|uniref:DUF6934 family protein n=1 Tax=Dyadobacter sp. CY261 TaxID=2907203 RepID=UPI001F25D801|nr:hypothetical protein [Dyadobacter sp. CY261]MCF0070629.1 hypothetical protein [Dyadobacter sp. CY261]